MWLLLFLAILISLVYVSGLKCYTCGVIEDQACSSFQMEKPQFSQECDNSSRSCRIARKVNDNLILSRSCEPLKMDDCKTANSIEYCYCTKDLCNVIQPLDDDDEDGERFLEGSGTETITHRTSSTPKIHQIEKVFSNCPKSQSKFCLGSIIIFAFISWL